MPEYQKVRDYVFRETQEKREKKNWEKWEKSKEKTKRNIEKYEEKRSKMTPLELMMEDGAGSIPPPVKSNSGGGFLNQFKGLGKDVIGDIGHFGKNVFTGLGELGKVAFTDYTLDDMHKKGKELTEENKARSNQFSSGLSREADRFLKRAGNSATLDVLQNEMARQGFNTDFASDRSGWGKAADISADLAGYLIPGTASYKGARMLGAGAKLTPGAGLLKNGLQLAKEGAAAGAIFGLGEAGVREATNPEQFSLGDHAKNIALDTTIGAIADPALMGLGTLLKKSPLLNSLLSKFKKGEINQAQFDDVIEATPELKQELLLLPEGKKQLPEPLQRTVEKWKYNYSKSVDVPEGLALPEGKTQTVIPARKTDYGTKLKTLMDAAQDLPPGREREALEDIWSRMAGPNDPSLDKLIELGTPSLKSLSLDPFEAIKKARDNYSKSAFGLDTKFNKLKQTKEFAPSNNLGNPLQFKRPAYNIKTPEQLSPQSFVGQTNQLSKTKVEYNAPKIDDNLLNNLEYGDKIKVRNGRSEVELTFVKREGNQVVVKRKSGKETVVPAEMVSGRVTDQLKIFKGFSKNEAAATKTVNGLTKANDLPKVQPKKITDDPFKKFKPLASKELTKLKDISGFKAATNDVFRNIRDVFGKSEGFEIVKKNILEPLEQSKAEYVQMQKNWTDKLKTEIVDGLGIKKGTKESALVQQFGEKEITLEELKKKSPDKWQGIVEADKWFRKAYDELIDTINTSRAKIYPNNPDKLVPKREDYYRHFNEFSGLTGLKNIFDTPGAIDPHLAGTSQYTQPKSKFAGFMQKRGVGPFKRDAVGGFLEYLPGASYATKIDANIPRLREFKNQLADATQDSRNLNNFLEFIDNYANDLAGKTNPYFDRNIQSLIPGGRKTFKVLTQLNNRVKANTILGNVSSALAQTANIPNGIAFTKLHSVNGFKNTIKSIWDSNAPMQQSNFLKERYSQVLYRRFNHKLIDQPKKMAEWVIETADRVGTSFIWNSAYEKAIKEGVPNPIHFADDNTRRLVAGRGVGEVPLLQKSKTIQLAMPFTLEVGNLWRVMGDMAKQKDVTGIMTLFVANFVLNKAIEEIRGFDATFDPIQATIEAFSTEDITPLQRAGIIAGEALTNLPSGQFVANLYPERGKFAGIQGPTRKELFGENNPQRFGTGLVAAGGITDPLFKLLPSFGGNQLKKSLGGLDTLSKNAAFKKGSIDIPFLGDYKEMNYPVNDNLENRLKGTLFGPGALDETKEYYKEKRRPLSEEQTETYKKAKEAGKGDLYYENLMRDRRVDTIKGQISKLKKDKKLTEKEKEEKFIELKDKLQKALKGEG